ncbi:MAG TPA: dihydrofolate reductase family protein [Candidatus Limnocylindria bacterium]|nr:dihydrofolate reductase family protein [Candidatus Limnocylindria bacterium]
MAEVTRLGPAGTVDVDALHRDLLDPPAHARRPHVALNFVMTADGRVTYKGRAEIGTRTDRELMFHIRSLADAVMIGAGTLRVDPFAPAAKGRERQPLAVVVSRTAKLPLGNAFFSYPGERLVATTASAPPDAVAAVRAAGATVETFGDPDVDLARLLAALRERGVRFLLCEGGPTLAGQLLATRLVDELFLTHATLVTAEPDARRLFEGSLAPSGTVRLERVSLHERDGEWYERSRIRYW